MTRRGLMFRISLAVAMYAIAIGIGCDLRFRFPKREDLHYVLFRDLVPLIVAIPATWLAYCLQRRASYLQQLRAAWGKAVAAAQGAIRYTYKRRPTPDDHGTVLEELGSAIDGVRGLFREGKSSPQASLGAIRDEIEALGSGEAVTPSRAESALSIIRHHWDVASSRLLLEFDRVPPGTPASGPTRAAHPAVGGPSEARSRLTTHLARR